MEERFSVTGLMSGSSMDGVDLAYCDFVWNGKQWDYNIIAAETSPYDTHLLRKLGEACSWSQAEIENLDLELGHFYADLLNDFHRNRKLYPDFIASHGHTILHEPQRGVTLQAGNGRIMAEKTGITVINDFRSEDVAQGGQGAPLVPIGDRMLFPDYDGCLNLGGFANISFENAHKERIAYDPCPANMALNSIAALEGLAFDMDGEMARRGNTDKKLLEKLNHLDYYKWPPPKSLGREWFLDQFLPLMQQSSLSNVDLMATVVEHIALQISGAINNVNIGTLLITGGGVLNQTLVERLKYHTTASLVIPDERLLNYKEALIFALLGLLRVRGEINCLASVTGGKEDISAGTIYKI